MIHDINNSNSYDVFRNVTALKAIAAGDLPPQRSRPQLLPQSPSQSPPSTMAEPAAP